MSSHRSQAQCPRVSIPRVQNNGSRCLVPSIISITRRKRKCVKLRPPLYPEILHGLGLDARLSRGMSIPEMKIIW
jgi:hypothetical protein